MKKQLLKISLMTFALLGICTSCSQNEDLDQEGTSFKALNITAQSQDFNLVGKTRVTEGTDKSTVFENGDQMGIYVIETASNTIYKKNFKLTYNGTDWVSDSELYYYENCNYIGYFPYEEALNAEIITDEDGIKNYFVGKLEKTDQSTKEGYYGCDLLIKTIKASDITVAENNAALAFQFTHAFSMIEFNIPTYMYKTNGGYEYNAPLNLSTIKVLKTDENEDLTEWYRPTKGMATYRKIVPAGSYGISAKLFDLVDTKPVSFNQNAVTVVAGEYCGFKLDYTGAPSTDRVTRDIKVGDYYYSDGSICPQEYEIPSTNCIGVIYSVGQCTEQEKAAGYSQGWVVSTKHLGQYAWSSEIDKLHLTQQIELSNTDGLMKEMNGYGATQEIFNNANFSATLFPAFNRLKNSSITTPDNCSGWYIPSIGQAIAIYNDLGAKDDSHKITVNNCTKGNSNAATVITNLNTILTKGGGSALPTAPIWTATEQSESKCYMIDLSASKFFAAERVKNASSARYILPVLAF